jgi:uncharacterized protein (DUF1015 family)
MDIAPFAALRYADTSAGEIDRCVSLPYDQFGDEGRDERYRRHPHNVVRLIKPRANEAPAHDVARDTLASWRREGVVVADDAASVYPYRQRFTRPGGDDESERWSFIARLRLTPFDAGPTRPHERTYPDTVGERSHLREVVGADLGLILVVYDDAGGDIDALVQTAAEEACLFEARDETGTANALWRWEQRQRVADLQQRLAAASGFIADGHHRYTAALGHWRARGGAADDPAAWVMAAMVSASSPGLRILPTHRLTDAAPGGDEVAAWRRAGLGIERLASASTAGAVAGAAQAALAAHGADHAVVYVHRDSGELCADLVRAPRGGLADAPWPDDVPASWRGLDVAVLHSLMLDPWMADVLRSQTEEHGALGYCNEILESVRLVERGERGAAFLINPLSVAEVQAVVAAGDVLPPKSTNFYPKVIAGLTINAFGNATGA